MSTAPAHSECLAEQRRNTEPPTNADAALVTAVVLPPLQGVEAGWIPPLVVHCKKRRTKCKNNETLQHYHIFQKNKSVCKKVELGW